mgnify:CR=1 FL=1
MSSQKRTIMGACDYSLSTLNQLKKDLSDIGAKHSETNWAIGGIVITLVSNLIRTCATVFEEAAQSGEPNAKQDITEIQARFNDFINSMLNQD